MPVTALPSWKRAAGVTILLASFVALLGTVVVLGTRPDGSSERAPGSDGRATPAGRSASVADPAGAGWRALALGGQADWPEYYTSLRQMARTATATIVGEVEEVQPGRTVGEAPDDLWSTVVVSVRVTRVVAVGTTAGAGIEVGDVVPVEFGPVEPETASEPALTSIVGDVALFFLRRKGEAVAEFGISEVPEEQARGWYRLVSPQGLYVDDAGRADAVHFSRVDWPGESGFPAELDGRAFADVVEEVARVAA